MNAKLFGVKCKQCREWMLPMQIKGFADRLRFFCPSEKHPDRVSLLKGKLKQLWKKYKKPLYKSLELQTVFLDTMDCYLDSCSADNDNPMEKCKRCRGKKRWICQEFDVLNEYFCTRKKK